MSNLTKLDSVTFDELLEEQDPFEMEEPVLDLTGVGFITPAGLVQLAACCYALSETGRRPCLTIDDEGVQTYLDRAGFLNVIREVADIEPPRVHIFRHYRGSNPMLIEVTRIETGKALPSLLDQIILVLRHRLRYAKHDAFDIATVISEVSQNTFDHNKATCGFLAMQVYGRAPQGFLEIGVADYGQGLAATLRRNAKNGHIASDLEAIKFATQLGTSEHDDPTRGTGLYHLLEISYKHRGSVQIRSGGAKVRFRMDRRMGWEFDVSEMPGVQIALVLSEKNVVDN